MVTAPRRYRHISAADYLAGDNDGQWRHEFVDGAVYPMPEMAAEHSLIRGEVVLKLMKVRETLDVFSSDFKLRVRTDDRDRFYYPDVFVTHRTERGDPYYATDAILTVEVCLRKRKGCIVGRNSKPTGCSRR